MGWHPLSLSSSSVPSRFLYPLSSFFFTFYFLSLLPPFFPPFYILLACGLPPPFFLIHPPPLSLSEYLSPFSLLYFLIYPFSFLLRLFLRLSSTLALFNPIFSSPFLHTTSLFLDLSHFSSGFTSSMPRRFELSTCQSLFTQDFLSCAS